LAAEPKRVPVPQYLGDGAEEELLPTPKKVEGAKTSPPTTVTSGQLGGMINTYQDLVKSSPDSTSAERWCEMAIDAALPPEVVRGFAKYFATMEKINSPAGDPSVAEIATGDWVND
jgi:hypothetical protein